MDANTLTVGAAELIRKLDPDEIRREIERLDRERDALFVLLRAAMRGGRDQRTPSRATA
jgi:hypothetical protein